MSARTDDTRKLVTMVAEKSRASITRPRMAEDVEKRLDPVERKSASCYAELELNTHKLQQLAEELESAAGIPITVEDEDSLVTHIDELQLRAKIPT